MKELQTQLTAAYDSAIQEMEKFLGGNSAAGTRARKALQEIKNLAQSIRKAIQEQKNTKGE